jgi:hypothetical protein
MENTLKHTNLLSHRDIAYYRRRNQNRQFAELATFFAQEAENGRTTRKEIAALLGKDPSQITRWLSSPSNLESDTVSDLLLAMGAEMDHRIMRFADRPTSNYEHPVFINTSKATTNASQRISFKQYVERPQVDNETQINIERHEESSTTATIVTEVRIHAPV